MQILSSLVLAIALAQNSQHAASVMGFDQDKTTHHFLLYNDGAVKDKADTKNRDSNRSHLPHIAMMFGEGDFNVPMLVHETKDVPGTKELGQLKGKLTYNYVETPSGGPTAPTARK